jgi:hypothetical protein
VSLGRFADNKTQECIVVSGETNQVRFIGYNGSIARSQEWGGPNVCSELVLVDMDNDGKDEIVYVTPDAVDARNAQGDLIAHTTLPDRGRINRVLLLRAWGQPPGDHLVAGSYTNSDEFDYLLSLDATTILGPVEWDQIEPRIRAIPVAPAGTSRVSWARGNVLQKPAPIAGIKATRLQLRLLNDLGQVVYREVIAPSAGDKLVLEGAMVSPPGNVGEPRILLVAYGDVIWQILAVQ